MTKPSIRFDEAWLTATELVRSELVSLGRRVVLLRDVRGRISVAIDDRGKNPTFEKAQRDRLEAALSQRLGAFAARGRLVATYEDLLLPEEIFENLNSAPLDPSLPQGPRILERFIVGADWLRPSLEPSSLGEPRPKRVTFFGIKGGVGRSTALAVVAQRLSQLGISVLVLDLDLESPGVGATLLPPEETPEFGIVDWFVEQGVGQADEALANAMVAYSPLASDRGSIHVVPAGGRLRDGYGYLAKLARVYSFAPLHSGRSLDFAARLHELVEYFEQRLKPDVVLLDSRAGLHDIAAVTVTRLGATSLLFAVDSAQTWAAYSWLFKAWRDHPKLARALVDNLKVVAALTPETGAGEYLQSLNAHAYNLFVEHLYEEVTPGEVADLSWDLEDKEAPHSPLRAQWSRALQTYDPFQRPGDVTPEQVMMAYQELFRWLDPRLQQEEP